MYANWPHDRAIIEKAGKTVTFASEVDASDFDPICPVVFIPPYCELKLGGFTSICKAAERAGKNDFYVAFIPKVSIPSSRMSFGFTLVMYMINWFSSLPYFRKLVQSTDILVTFVCTKGKQQYLQNSPNSGLLPTTRGIMSRHLLDAGAILKDPPLMWIIKTRRLGPWILFYGLFYMPIFFTFLWIHSLAVYTALNATLVVLLTYFTTRNYVSTPSHAIYCLLSPVYFLLFPLVLIHGKIND